MSKRESIWYNLGRKFPPPSATSSHSNPNTHVLRFVFFLFSHSKSRGSIQSSISTKTKSKQTLHTPSVNNATSMTKNGYNFFLLYTILVSMTTEVVDITSNMRGKGRSTLRPGGTRAPLKF